MARIVLSVVAGAVLLAAGVWLNVVQHGLLVWAVAAGAAVIMWEYLGHVSARMSFVWFAVMVLVAVLAGTLNLSNLVHDAAAGFALGIASYVLAGFVPLRTGVRRTA